MRRFGWKSACGIEISREVSEKYFNMKEKRADTMPARFIVRHCPAHCTVHCTVAGSVFSAATSGDCCMPW